MSFKIRDGKSEIKLLEKNYGPKIFSNYAIGSVEKWIKWSLALKDANASPETLFSTPQEFQEIKKERLLLKYEVPNAETLRRIDPTPESNNTFQLELSRIESNGKLYFSLGLEMAADKNLRIKTFYRISESFFSGVDCQNLNAENSYGYPRFLQLHQEKNVSNFELTINSFRTGILNYSAGSNLYESFGCDSIMPLKLCPPSRRQ